ncbi:MAG: hypothetical protein ABFR75_12005 [Acidobacteriota bacterium]
MGEELYKIFKYITDKRGNQARLLLAEKTGISMSNSMEIEDSEEMVAKFHKAVKEIEGDMVSTGPSIPSSMPESSEKNWKEIGNKMIEEIVNKLAKLFGKEFAEEIMAPETKKIETLGPGSTINDIKNILLPKVRKKFKEFMNSKEIESWFEDTLNKLSK